MAHSNGYDGNMIPLLSNNDGAQTAYNMDNLKLRELISKHPLPLGLKLTLTPEMLPLTEQKRNAATCSQTEVKKVDKLKAAHFPMHMLMIGLFKVEAKYPADLVAKFYYAKRKLVWEILRDGLKDKIEVHWQNISAIRAVINEDLPGILEIELDKVPTFYREIEPKPGKHTMWTLSHDFTHAQASKYRRHYLQFHPGVLDRYYTKLLQCDNRLMELNQKHFPNSHDATYFDSYLDKRTTQLVFCHHDSNNTLLTNQQQFGPTINNQMLQDPMLTTTSWSNQHFHYDTILSMEPVPRVCGMQLDGHRLNYELVPSHVNNMLLGGYHIPEIEFDRRHDMWDSDNLVGPNVGQSIEASLGYNTNISTQIDWSLLS